MLLIEAFYDRERYISPEDEITIHYEIKELFDIWKTIVIPNSSSSLSDLPKEQRSKLLDVFKNLEDVNFNQHVVIGTQFDKLFVKLILWASSKICKRKEIIDAIFNKTKSSMFVYFYHDLIVDAYLSLKDLKSAFNVIKYMLDKNHIAYQYAILKYNENAYSNKEFIKGLNDYKEMAKINLLASGERVDLKDVNFEKLQTIVGLIQSKKKA
jgi:hypothetical protein